MRAHPYNDTFRPEEPGVVQACFPGGGPLAYP